MPVPNEVDATYPDQSEIDRGDIVIWEKPAAGYWVVSGGVVTAQGTPNGTVAVSAGTGRVGGSNKTITAGNVSVLSGAANPDGSVADVSSSTETRFCLITLNGSSQLGVLHGDPAGLSPNNDGSYLAIFPDATNYLVLASVIIPPGVSTVTNGMISTKRIVGSADAFHDQIHTPTGTNHTGLGAKGSLLVGTATNTNGALTVGANDTVLTADSAQTTGLKWVAPATRRFASLTASSGAIANTETVVLSGIIPANSLVAGDVFLCKAGGHGTTGVTPGTGTWRLRIGPTTLTGAAAATSGAITLTASRTSVHYWLEAQVDVLTIGASGTMNGTYMTVCRLTTQDLFTTSPWVVSTAATAIDTTVQNLVELTFVSSVAGSSSTFFTGVIQKV